MRERLNNIWYPRGSKSNEVAQAVINNAPDLEQGFKNVYRPYVDTAEVLGGSDTILEENLHDAYYNLTQASTIHIGMLSAEVKDQILDMCKQLSSVPDRQTRDAMPTKSGFMWPPQPPAVERYVDILTGLAATAQSNVWNSDRQIALLRMELYHQQVYDLSHEMKLRGKPLPSKIHPRWLEYTPRKSVFLSEDEKKRILENEPGLGVYRSVQAEQKSLESININSRGIMAAIFAASHVIEEKYPNISDVDATRLLLYNADRVGAQAWHKATHAPYMHDSVALTAANRSRFSSLITMAQNGPLALDSSDRLVYTKPQKAWGRCPLGNHVEINRHEAQQINQINRSIEKYYNVPLPVEYGTNFTLSTQFAIISILLGEGLLNGRSKEHIRTFRQMELMGMAALRPSKALTPEQLNQYWW
jgi:hypothetical protein